MRLRLALAAGIVLLAGIAIWLGVRTSRQAADIARLEAELQAARAAKSGPSAPARQAPAITPAPAEQRPAGTSERHDRAISSEMEELKARLRQATADIASTQTHMRELQAQLQTADAERARAAAAESDTRNRLAELNQKFDSVNAELATAQKRVRDMETENSNLRQRYAGLSQSNEQLRKLSAELQDITRRQQSYLNNVVTRYREVRDLFRHSGPVDPNIAAGPGPDVARIESTISMADEDLRALRELNVRLGAMQKQLSSTTKP